jgi:hypothetical protein
MSRLAAPLVTAATVLLAATPSHAADVEVSVPASITRSVIEDRMTDFMVDDPSTRLSWRPGVAQPTHLSGNGDDVLHVVLDLSSEEEVIPGSSWLFDVPLTLAFDLYFRCDSDGVGLRIINTVASIVVNSNTSWVPPEKVEAMRANAQEMLDTQTRPMLNDVWKKLKSVENSNLPGFRQVCPHFEVGSAGKITAEVDFDQGCINGRVQRASCPSGWLGGGVKARCVNGEWHRVTPPGCYPPGNQPDHPTPPGGHQP